MDIVAVKKRSEVIGAVIGILLGLCTILILLLLAGVIKEDEAEKKTGPAAASLEERVFALLDRQEEENTKFAEKWERKEKFTTQDLRELTVEFEHLRIKHRGELREILKQLAEQDSVSEEGN